MNEKSIAERMTGVYGFLVPAGLLALAIFINVNSFLLTAFGIGLFAYFGLPWLRTYFEAYAAQVALKVIREKK